jgi:hypothetical protein
MGETADHMRAAGLGSLGGGLTTFDLFSFDKTALQGGILVNDPGAVSNIEYDEYAVYKRTAKESPTGQDDDVVTHRINQDETPGFQMLDMAFRNGYVADYSVGCPISALANMGN